MKTLLKQDSYK